MVAVAVAERLTMWASIRVHQVPGVPATRHTQIVAVWSTIKSPTAKVPLVGAPLVVPPTYLVAAVAPVRPETLKSGATTSPVNVAPERGASCESKFASTVWAI